MTQITFTCKGHPNIKASHKTTFEFSKEASITKNADCVLGVSSTLTAALIQKIKPKHKIEIHLKSQTHQEKIIAYTPKEINENATVVRTNNLWNNKTLALYADKSAAMISRPLIEELKDPNSVLSVKITQKEPYETLEFIEGYAHL